MPRPILPEVMKARAGVPASDLLALLWAKKLQRYSITTITGVPPISFKSDGSPLISWSMLGNGQQTGTPTPDAPIMPEFVGVRTANLFDAATVYGSMYDSATGVLVGAASTLSSMRNKFASSMVGVPITISIHADDVSVTRAYIRCAIDGSNIDSNSIANGKSGTMTVTVTPTSVNDDWRITFGTGAGDLTLSNIMLNSGSTAKPYEPYGYKLSITSAGQTQAVYLGQVPMTRRVRKLVLTGNEGWRERLTFEYCDRFVLQKSGFTFQTESGYCSHFEVSTNLINTYPVMIYDNGQNIVVNYSAKGTTTLTQFKQWLSDQYTNGTPVTAWYVLTEPETAIVNEPLAKIGTYADELHSTDAGVTIPTAKGANVLTVDTDLQPSEMTITGHIKQA